MNLCPNKILSTGHTYLTYSCFTNELDLFLKLLERPTLDPNKKDLYGLTPLQYCVQNGDKQIYFINKLLSHGADHNILMNGYSILDKALEVMSLEGIKFLIEKGFKLHYPDINKIKIINLDFLIMEKLIDIKVLSNIQFSYFLIRNQNVVNYYYYNISKKTIYTVIKLSNCPTQLFIKLFRISKEHPFKIFQELMKVYLPNPNIVKVILNKLKYITQHMEKKIEIAMTGFLCHKSVSHLVEASINPTKIKLDKIDFQSWSLIDSLIDLSKPNLIKIMMYHPEAKKIFEFISQKYPHWLKKNNCDQNIKCKITKLWQIEILTKIGFNNKTIAENLYFGNLNCELTDWIIKNFKKNPEIFKNNPLLIAIRYNSISSIQFMIEGGLSINVKDSSTGMSLLHYACAYPAESGIYLSTMLLDNGIDINAKDISGHTALYYLSIGFLNIKNNLKLFWIKRLLSYKPEFNLDTTLALTKKNSQILNDFIKIYPEKIKTHIKPIANALINSEFICFRTFKKLLTIDKNIDKQFLLEKIVLNKKLFFSIVKNNIIIDDFGPGEDIIKLLLSKGSIFSNDLILEYLTVIIEAPIKEHVNTASDYILRAINLIQKIPKEDLYSFLSKFIQIGTTHYIYKLVIKTVLDNLFNSVFDNNPNSGELLNNACRLGLVEIVKHLVEKVKLNLNYVSDSGYCPLHYALYCPTSQVLSYLVKQQNTKSSFNALVYYLTDLKQLCNILHVKIMLKHLGNAKCLSLDEKGRNILDYLELSNLLRHFIDDFSSDEIESVYFRTGNLDKFLKLNKVKKKDTSENCLICFQPIGDNKWIVCNHNHHFHVKCLFRWFSQQNSNVACPNCCQKFKNIQIFQK